MKLWEIFRFEFTYQARRVPTWLYFAVLVFLTFIQGTDGFADAARNGDHFLGAPFVIAARTMVGCLIWLLVAAFVAGDAAARDVETGMYPLTYTTPVSKADYLGGRFLAAFVINAVLQLAVMTGVLLSIYGPEVEAEIRGPFLPAAYLTAYAFIALPSAFLITAIQFSFAALSRRAIASYLGGLTLLVLAFAVTANDGLALHLGREVGHLLDPLGIASIEELTRGWTRIELNTRLIMEGSLLANRLLWVGVALGTLAFTYIRFRVGHHTASTVWSRIMRRREAVPTPAGTGIARSTPISVPQVRRTFGFATRARQTLAIGWDSFGNIARSLGGLVLLALVALLAVATAFEGLSSMGVPLLPRTDYVLRGITQPDVPPAWFVIPLIMVFWSAKLVWREREARVSEIGDAAPVPEWVLFLGRFTGLGLALVACQALRMAAGVFAQVNMGYHDVEIGPYLQILFGIQLADYLFLALLALVVHVVVNQKHVGHLMTVIALVLLTSANGTGFGHHLLVYGSGPEWSYTDMSGFGPSLGPWLWFKLYWAAWAVLLAVAARLLLVRGKEGGLAGRLQLARRRFTRATAGTTAVAVALIVTVGGFIFYNTNVLNAYDNASEWIARRVDYERRYGRYEGIPQPRLTGINLHVEIYPERREVGIRGTYRLVNASAVSIDSVHLATYADVENGEVTFDRPARSVLADDDLGHRIYAFETPLQPGDSVRLNFELRVEPRGFRNNGVDASVVTNGTYFNNQPWLPAIGYQPSRQISDAMQRRTHGLPPRPGVPSLDDVEARRNVTAAVPIAFEAVVGTDEGQIAVAPGVLRRTWTEGGRRYFHYVTDAPIGNEYAFFSADYAVHEAQWNGVAIQIYHHPGHDSNLERMVRSVRASLDYYTKQFGPYPYSYLRLVERPGHGFGAHAEASTVDFGEGFSLLNPDDGPGGFDLPFYVVAHEVAHQWWGSSWVARVEGVGFLSEALASYSGYQVLEETYGQEHLRRFLGRLRTEYETPPARAAVPLLRANHAFLFYRKGPFAMYALSEYIGEARVNDALRRFRERGSGGPLLPTTLDLYRELQAVTPDSLHQLLHDLFEANTYWDLETRAVRADSTAAGEWRVTLDVRARKVVIDTAGVETEVPMDDWVVVGVFAAALEGEATGKPLYLQKHRIRAGEQTITVTVPQRPARAGIDPYHVLDWEKAANDGNTKRVEIGR